MRLISWTLQSGCEHYRIYFYVTHFYKAKKSKLLTVQKVKKTIISIVLYTPKQNLGVKQIFV
jgi:hypothetical protein